MALFNIIVDIVARTANVEAGLKRVEARFGEFGDAVRKFAGLVSVGALAGFTKNVLESGDEIMRMSSKANMSVESFQKLSYAAKLSGVSAESVAGAMNRMQIAIGEASDKSGAASEAIKALGLNTKDLKGLSPEELFGRIADQMLRLKDPTDQVRAAQALFKKSFQELLPVLREGSEGLRKAGEEAGKLGGIFTEEQLKKLKDAHDAMNRMESAAKNAGTALVEKMSPALSDFFNSITAYMRGDPIGKMADRLNFLKNVASNPWVTPRTAPDVIALAELGFGGGTNRPIMKPNPVWQDVQGEINALEMALKPELTPGTTGLILGPQKRPPGPLDITKLLKEGTQASIEFNTAIDRSKEVQAEFMAKAERVASPKAPPGYQEDISKYIDSLMIHPTVARMREPKNFDDELIKSIEDAGAAALRKLTETRAKISAAWSLGLITTEDADRFRAEAEAIYDAAFDLEEVKVSVHRDIRVILTDAQERIRDFAADAKFALTDAFNMGGNLAENFVRRLIDILGNRALYEAIDRLGGALGGLLENAAGSSGGGFFNTLVQAIFGSNAAAAAQIEPVQITAQYIGIGRASGGPVSPGMTYLVGERGAEYFTPSMSGMISPAGAAPVIHYSPTYEFRGSASELSAFRQYVDAQDKENSRRIFDEFDRRYAVGR